MHIQFLLQTLLRRGEASVAASRADPERFLEYKKHRKHTPLDELLILGGISHGLIQHQTMAEHSRAQLTTPISDIRTQPLVTGDIAQDFDTALLQAKCFAELQDDSTYNLSTFEQTFDVNNFDPSNPSANLPTYEEIMSAADSAAALVPNPNLSFP